MKTFILGAATAAVIFGSFGQASAQYGDAVPIGRTRWGEPACPSNYVIRGNACVSIYAGRRAYRERRYPGRYDDSGYAVAPRMNYRGEPQCPSNYVIRGGACVSLY